MLSERSRLRDLHKKSSSVGSEDRVMLAAHPEVLGVPSEAIQEGRVRVAETEGKIIGFSVLGFSGCESELDGLFVDPAVHAAEAWGGDFLRTRCRLPQMRASRQCAS